MYHHIVSESAGFPDTQIEASFRPDAHVHPYVQMRGGDCGNPSCPGDHPHDIALTLREGPSDEQIAAVGELPTVEEMSNMPCVRIGFTPEHMARTAALLTAFMAEHYPNLMMVANDWVRERGVASFVEPEV